MPAIQRHGYRVDSRFDCNVCVGGDHSECQKSAWIKGETYWPYRWMALLHARFVRWYTQMPGHPVEVRIMAGYPGQQELRPR